MNLLKNFNVLVSSFMKETAEEMEKFRQSINDPFEEFKKTSTEMLKELKDEIKKTKTSFIVEVPFNKESDQLTYSVDGDTITVTTKTKTDTSDSTSTTTATIPDEFDRHNLIQKYDEKNKKMKFIFITNFFKKKKNESNKNDKSEKDESEKPIIERRKLLDRILELNSKGWSYRRIAKEVGISDKTVKRWIASALKQD